MKAAAAKAGMSLDEFKGRVAAGEKLCWKCRTWRSRSDFSRDRSRSDGLSARCQPCSRVKEKVCRKGERSPFLGKAHTEQSRAKMSVAKKGMPSPLRGRTLPRETREKISNSVRLNGARGSFHHAWKDGAKERNKDARRVPEYKVWRLAVFTRDNFLCRKCGDDRGQNLRAHHIKPFADFPELRFDVSNGLTLCHDCHELEHFQPGSVRNARKLRRGEKLFA